MRKIRKNEGEVNLNRLCKIHVSFREENHLSVTELSAKPKGNQCNNEGHSSQIGTNKTLNLMIIWALELPL